jgi:hypothetical protein
MVVLVFGGGDAIFHMNMRAFCGFSGFPARRSDFSEQAKQANNDDQDI